MYLQEAKLILESTKFIYVKTIIKDGNKILHTKYLRINEWDIPGGKIDPGEIPIDAAARELRERTGYTIDAKNLKFIKIEDNFGIYEGNIKDIKKVAEPGELGGYKTQIKWIKLDKL